MNYVEVIIAQSGQMVYLLEMRPERRSLRALILILVVASTVTGAIASAILYRTALSQKSEFLLNNVTNLARLIDSVAHFDRTTFRDVSKSTKATLKQIESAFSGQSGFGNNGEILLGRLERDKVTIFLRYRDHKLNPNLFIPYSNSDDAAMHRALNGQTGVGEFFDTRGQRVLAAFTYIPYLKTGLEIRVPVAELIEPYLYSGLIITAASGCVILLCVYLFLRVSRPVMQELEKHRRLTEAVVDSAEDIILTVDSAGFVRLINPAGMRALGYTRDEVECRDIALLFSTEDALTANVLASIRAQKPVIAADTIVQLRKKSGATFPSSITCGQKEFDDNSLTTIVLHDLTARKQAEDTIRLLTHKTIEIKDREQDEISRELHDTLGTSLVWLKLQSQRIIAGKIPDTDFNDLMQNFDDTVELTRNLSHSLSPIAIEKLGLPVMLHRLVEKANHVGHALVTLQIENLEKNFLGKVTFHIFRMVQEALNNALRHSQARNIRITGKNENNKISILVTDDGIGFDTSARSEGLGLALISERAHLLGGIASYRSKKNQGTEVKIELPCP